MVKSRLIHLLLSLTLVFTLVGGFLAAQTAVFAQDCYTHSVLQHLHRLLNLHLHSTANILSLLTIPASRIHFGVDIKYAGTR